VDGGGNYYMRLRTNFIHFPAVNFEDELTFGKVTAKIKLAPYFMALGD